MKENLLLPIRGISPLCTIVCLLVFQIHVNAQAPTGYKLTWSDEFNSTSLDTTMWKYRIGVSGTSYQRSENVTLEDGKLKINLKKEAYKNQSFTGGGVITKRPKRYGYYETRVKLDGGYGWHEAFWTSWMSGFDDKNPAYKNMDKLEIDCFEHYAEYANNHFTYGAIQWSPINGNANRDFVTVSQNLTTDYHVFGFEYTPDYLNYYYNGKLLKTIDTRRLPKHDLHLWLSCIAKKPDATASGAVFFDYLRCYEISAIDYKLRKKKLIDQLDSLKLPVKSMGTDIWIETEDFKNLNSWTKELDENAIVLLGNKKRIAGRDSLDLSASTTIKIEKAQTYRLWVRARDFDLGPGSRKFKVIVNGQEVKKEFGNHGTAGYAWQDGGVFNFPKGNTTLMLFDSSQNFARCDKILLSTDLNFVPKGIGK